MQGTQQHTVDHVMQDNGHCIKRHMHVSWYQLPSGWLLHLAGVHVSVGARRSCLGTGVPGRCGCAGMLAVAYVGCQEVLVSTKQRCYDCHQQHCVPPPPGADGVLVAACSLG
jgi:hypothetical protein